MNIAVEIGEGKGVAYLVIRENDDPFMVSRDFAR